MLTHDEKKLHAAVLECAKDVTRSQRNLIRYLIQVESLRYYRKMNRRNLSEFIRKDLRIDGTYTYELVRVTEKALQFPVLAEALNSGKFGSCHASRIISTMNAENAAELVSFASCHSFRQVDEFMAKKNPNRRTRETGKWISEDQFRVSIVLSKEEYELMRSVQDGEAQCNRPAKMKDAVVAGLKDYLERRDRVKRAERAAKRIATQTAKRTADKRTTDQHTAAPTKQATTHPTMRSATQPPKQEVVSSPHKAALTKTTFQNVRTYSRVPFTAVQKHETYLRSGGRCSFHDHRGRCESRRYLHIHHKLSVKDGGTNDPANLVLLCSYHHDFVHQLSFAGLESEYSFSRVGEGRSMAATS